MIVKAKKKLLKFQYFYSGLIWGMWHITYYMFFLPDEYFTKISRPMMVVEGIYSVIVDPISGILPTVSIFLIGLNLRKCRVKIETDALEKSLDK